VSFLLMYYQTPELRYLGREMLARKLCNSKLARARCSKRFNTRNKKPAEFYFLDTNILIYTEDKALYSDKEKLRKWLHERQGTLFVTEQIRDEYFRGNEHPQQLPSFVQFQHSTIEPGLKKECVRKLLELFREQRENIEPDLYALVEAGYALGPLFIAHPSLIEHSFHFLTNNMGIIHAAQIDLVLKQGMERIINACGLEHLIPVKPLNHTIVRNHGQ